jgi:hypothetical protein
MWIAFGNRFAHRARDIVSQNNVVEREGCSWAMWEVGDSKCAGNATVFVEEDKVRQTRGIGGRNQRWEDEIAPV